MLSQCYNHSNFQSHVKDIVYYWESCGCGSNQVRMRKEAIVAQLELAKKRCTSVISRIEALSAFTGSINASCWRTLLKLAQSELSFLSQSSSSLNSLSINIGHIEAVVHILQQPFITGVSRVCKPILWLPASKTGQKSDSCSKGVHVDIVCSLNGKPVWIIVSDRNPKYILWDQSKKHNGLKSRIEQEVLVAARSSVALKPSSIILFFSKGLSSFVYEKLKEQFEAAELGLEFSVFDFDFNEDSEGDWINVLARTYQEACILEIKVNEARHAVKAQSSECHAKGSSPMVSKADLSEECSERNMGFSFCSLLSRMEVNLLYEKDTKWTELQSLLSGGDVINFDTTALIALISGISNGAAEKLLATPEGELRQRFKGNYEFVIGQVMSEIQNPMHVELGSILYGKGGIICESVCAEFKDLVAMCGGFNEKLRAAYLLRKLMIVPDCPSDRMMSLPTTRKLALKNKIVFGTGDYWHAPTLTANMAFVRAISQTGMSLFTILHKPRALTGD